MWVAITSPPPRFLVSLSVFPSLFLSLLSRALRFSLFLSLLSLFFEVRRCHARLWHGCGGDIGGNDIDPAPISGLSLCPSGLSPLSQISLSFSPSLLLLLLSCSLSLTFSFFLSFSVSQRRALTNQTGMGRVNSPCRRLCSDQYPNNIFSPWDLSLFLSVFLLSLSISLFFHTGVASTTSRVLDRARLDNHRGRVHAYISTVES